MLCYGVFKFYDDKKSYLEVKEDVMGSQPATKNVENKSSTGTSVPQNQKMNDSK